MIGLRNGHQTGSRVGSLLDWGIGYKEIDLIVPEEPVEGNSRNYVFFDLNRIDQELAQDPTIKLIHIQRYILMLNIKLAEGIG